MKFDLDLKTGKFGKTFNHILESENPIALSYDNYEDLSEVIEAKTGFAYDELLYKDACEKALVEYKDNRNIFDVDYGVNLYNEFEKIFNNGYEASVPSDESDLYMFLKEFDQDMSDEEVEYTDELFVSNMVAFMFSRLYETKVKDYVAFIEDLEHGFTNESEKLSKLALDEIAKFVINPWIEKTNFEGLTGEEDIEYKLDELVAQSYCKCDYQTALGLYMTTEMVKNNEKHESKEIQGELNKLASMLKEEKLTKTSVYSDELVQLGFETYMMILNYDVRKFIEENK
ncbi:MAG: hypothetical protein ACRCTZ_02600 [Sarcina sp.]